MINSLLTLTYSCSVFIVGLMTAFKYRKLLPALLISVFIPLPLRGAEEILAFGVSGIIFGYFIRLAKKSCRQVLIPLTLLSLSFLLVVTYQTSLAYLFTLSTGLGASTILGIAYSTLTLGESNTPPAIKHLTDLKLSVKPVKIVNYLTAAILTSAVTLLANYFGGGEYAAIVGLLTSIGLYAYFRFVKNKYALLTLYFIGCVLAWLALNNNGIQSFNNWIKFFNEVILTWEKNVL